MAAKIGAKCHNKQIQSISIPPSRIDLEPILGDCNLLSLSSVEEETGMIALIGRKEREGQ